MGGVLGSIVFVLAAMAIFCLWCRRKGRGKERALSMYDGDKIAGSKATVGMGASGHIRNARPIGRYPSSHALTPEQQQSLRETPTESSPPVTVVLPPSLDAMSLSHASGPSDHYKTFQIPHHRYPQQVVMSQQNGTNPQSPSDSTDAASRGRSNDKIDYGSRHMWTDQWQPDQWLAAEGGSAIASPAIGSASVCSNTSSQTAQAVHGKVAAAVKEMQGALQVDLNEDHLKVFRRLGAGGFGTVYHGVLSFFLVLFLLHDRVPEHRDLRLSLNHVFLIWCTGLVGEMHQCTVLVVDTLPPQCNDVLIE